MDYYDYDYMPTMQNASSTVNVWLIISIVVAIVGGIALYFAVFNDKNKGHFKGIMNNIYNYFSFNYFISNDIFKLFYIISAIALTLLSFCLIKTSIWYFLLTIIVGNVGLRIIYELLILLLELCKNVTEINTKIKEKK